MRKFTFFWTVENFSYCTNDTEEALESPTFFIKMMQLTSWKLQLYPRGDQDPDYIGLILSRCDDCIGPEKIALNCELSIFDDNRRILESSQITINDYEFEKGESYGFRELYKRIRNDQGEKNEIFASDILRVRCVMWVGSGKGFKEDFKCARTRIKLQKTSFINVIEDVGTLQLHQIQPFDAALDQVGFEFSGNVYVKSEPNAEETVMVAINPIFPDGILITCQIYLISSDGKEIECGKIDARTRIETVYDFKLPISFRKNFPDKKREYLPHDTLTLRCECIFSTGIEFERIEEAFYDIHLSPCLREKLYDSTVLCPAEDKDVLVDFKNFYKDRIFSDVRLKTPNKTFPAHRFVLCARSPIFKAMLTTNMKENIMNCIQIDDLEDATIDQFLLFLYTDVLEDLHWESALKLYYAGDKYLVQRLKDVFSSFLITRLDKSNFHHLLVLADIHQDAGLKKGTERFICMCNKQIFSTNEWESVMETNSELAIKTMHFYLKNSNY